MTCGCTMNGVWGWLMGPLGLVAMVGLWALLIWGGIALYRAWSQGRVGGDHAEEIVARRFAAGEITEDEYRERLSALREVRQPLPWGARR